MIEIKSNTQAIEMIKDLQLQGFLEESYITEPLANNRTKVTKIYKFRGRRCD